ncbi:hypothetical protein BN903_43 [Halorubrum sp. AJ67]|nr:hypothetical protein BN903_43 [Halorubrum sp. AJ67]
MVRHLRLFKKTDISEYTIRISIPTPADDYMRKVILRVLLSD